MNDYLKKCANICLECGEALYYDPYAKYMTSPPMYRTVCKNCKYTSYEDCHRIKHECVICHKAKTDGKWLRPENEADKVFVCDGCILEGFSKITKLDND